MVIKTVKGMYQVLKNHRDAFVEEAFCEKYIEECMDRYEYVVGDISSGILRLKGFDTDPKSKNYFGFIDDYLEVSCAFGCPFYILKRIHSNEEYEKKSKRNDEYPYEPMTVTPLKKENFDKESLVLESSGHGNPKIVIDIQKINSVPKGELAPDLVEFIKNDKLSMQANQPKVNQAKPDEATTSTYVSASEGFDPSKIQDNKFNRGFNNKKNNHNKNNNQNKNQNNNNVNNNQNRNQNNNGFNKKKNHNNGKNNNAVK